MQAKRSCWTCKGRKIGCDRRIPCCNNCIRTSRECLGYATRLIWPEESDHDRSWAVQDLAAADAGQASTYYGQRFLNFYPQDVQHAWKRLSGRAMTKALTTSPQRSLSTHTPICGQDAMLFSYYEHVIAPMCSTTRVLNGFRYEILSIAMSSRGASSNALCASMLAISAFHHLRQEAALPYKVSSLRLLSESLTTASEAAEAQLAACLMLCMYSVFDQDDGHFHVHLSGGRKILRTLRVGRPQRLASTFLATWFLYYETLGRFAQPSYSCDESDIISLFQELESEGTNIIGLLGCSSQTLHCIYEVNRMRALLLKGSSDIGSASCLFNQRVTLEKRLQHLVQHIESAETETAAGFGRKCVDIRATAELYRLAALLYLQRVCPTFGDEARRTEYLAQAFAAIAMLNVATSPWPIFVIACESQDEEQRILSSRMLEQMQKVRRIGNIQVLRKAIEMVWKQQDLRNIVDGDSQIKWWQSVDSDISAPWFA